MSFGALRQWGLLCVTGCLFLAGCNEGGEQLKLVTGKVVENGAPVPIPNYQPGYNHLQVDFYRLDDSGNLTNEYFGAVVAQDGTFKLTGEKGTGAPLGKYRAGVRKVDRTGRPDSSGNYDAFKGKYDVKKSPFVYDVTASTTEIVIDLAQGGAKTPAAPSK